MRITGTPTFCSCSAMWRSPAPTNVDGSTSHIMASTSFRVLSATCTMYSPSLFFALWIPGVSKNTICPSSQVYTVCILFLVVCGLFDVMAIFCPIRWFISVDFPTFGLPMIATKPDLKLLSILYPLIILSQPAIPFNGQQALFLISRSVASLP